MAVSTTSFWENLMVPNKKAEKAIAGDNESPRGLSLSSLPAIGSFLRWRGQYVKNGQKNEGIDTTTPCYWQIVSDIANL